MLLVGTEIRNCSPSKTERSLRYPTSQRRNALLWMVANTAPRSVGELAMTCNTWAIPFAVPTPSTVVIGRFQSSRLFPLLFKEIDVVYGRSNLIRHRAHQTKLLLCQPSSPAVR